MKALGAWILACAAIAIACANEPTAKKTLPEPATRTIDFARDVEPIFARACLSCHGPTKQRSGFRLDQRDAALAGGDLGKAIHPGKSAQSPLIRSVAGLDADLVMPPNGKRLTADEIATLRAWIDQGAVWPASSAPIAKVEPWWSLRPLVRPPVPPATWLGKIAANPVDAFVAKRLAEAKVTPSPEADRRTLIRRVTFDLHGLPPTAEEVDAFANDPAPDAYERLVDRLLASPRYGERWARHWLDVVHFGETHGYDKDKPRFNAWPYRDYVVRALNEDRDYSRFVREQLAGDVLYPGTPDGIEALGFLSAGPWDFIGHAEVAESRIDGKITRHLDRDDVVSTTLGVFNSLTVGCAQCHHHKFDPIRMEDYYRLHAVFAAIDRADKAYDRDPATAKRRHELATSLRTAEARRETWSAKVRAAAGPELAEVERRMAQGAKPTARRPEFGYHSGIAPDASVTKWVQVDLGAPVALARVEIAGCYDDFNSIGPGFGFPVRFKIEASDDPAFAKDVAVLVDRTGRDVANPGTAPLAFPVSRTARYVRVTATQLALRKSDYIFALAELRVADANGANLAAGRPVTALDAIEAAPRWSKRNLVDGIDAQATALPAAEIAKLEVKRRELLARGAGPEAAAALANAEAAVDAAKRGLAALPKPSLVYAGTVHTGAGPFAGTGAQGGKPRPIHVLARGDVRKPGAEVGPGAVAAVGLPATFVLPATHTEGDRRAALARWLTDAKNPLTWRSIVNRVWLHHFGRGLVDTPNDFGRMGQLPSHPELLDWLASEFRDGGQSLKTLHRLLVTSATYRQKSTSRPEAEAIDADNALLWRAPRRRLEAEAIRDSVLLVSGKLNLTMGGPSFQDFVIERPEHSPHYQYHLHDPEDVRTHRRSIYRFVVRSQQQPFLAALDCADPSIAVDKRNQTITPQQALALLNNPLMLAMSRHFAARVRALEPNVARQPRVAFRLALSRDPTPAEEAALSAYAARHGMENLCRLTFNLNEFAFVD